MEKLKKGFIWFWSNPKCVFLFGLVIAIAATAIEVFRGRNTNYFDYQDSTRMFWEGISPYNMEYVFTHAIYFLYSPVFNVVFAPIFLLPWWLGPFVWNIGNYSLFYLSIKTLPEKFDPYKHWIFLFLLSVLLQAIFCYQYNTIVCYIFIFAFSLLERGKGFWAVFLMMLSACTKVYGGVELVLLFCYPKMWRNFGYVILCGAGLLALPLLNTNFDNPLVLYQKMFDMIASHHCDSDFVGILFARGLKPFLLPNYRVVQMVVLAVLGVVFFSKYKMWKDFRFRVQSLAVLMGYIILFSDCPETHTYIISLTGYSMAFWMQTERKWYDWVLFWLLVVNFGVLPTDVLCPAWLHEYIHETFWLDVYTFALCWLRIIWLALFQQKSVQLKKVAVVIMLLILPFETVFAKGKQKQAGRPPYIVYNVKGVEFKMIYVQGGTYIMGNDKNLDDTSIDEAPRHKVAVNSFYIGETEVTQALWEVVMQKNRSKQKAPDNPVEYITYDDCKTFIAKLNSETGLKFRLPTEKEWEYAARGGRKSKKYLYAGSNDYTEVAFTSADGFPTHHSVKQLKPNELGIYDMSGNVWEWCNDFYYRYPKGKPSHYFHVIRGGSFANPPEHARVTNRFMYDTRRRRNLLGMRLALSPHQKNTKLSNSKFK